MARCARDVERRFALRRTVEILRAARRAESLVIAHRHDVSALQQRFERWYACVSRIDVNVIPDGAQASCDPAVP